MLPAGRRRSIEYVFVGEDSLQASPIPPCYEAHVVSG